MGLILIIAKNKMVTILLMFVTWQCYDLLIESPNTLCIDKCNAEGLTERNF